MVQKGSPYDGRRDYSKVWPHPQANWLVSLKIDGIRCSVQQWKPSTSKKADGDQLHKIFVSNRGKHLPNRFMRMVLETLPSGFDGELAGLNAYDRNSYAHISSLYAKLEEISTNWCLHVFNYFGDGSIADFCELPYHVRMAEVKAKLEQWQILHPGWAKHVQLLEQHQLGFDELGKADELIADWMEQGFEGAMLTTTHSPYRWGRWSHCHPHCLKYAKAFHDAEFRIVGFEEEYYRGTKTIPIELQGKPKGTLGALWLEGLRSNVAQYESFKCGSGFSREQREQFWQDRDKLLGQLVKVKFMDVGADNRPRHPVFQGLAEESA